MKDNNAFDGGNMKNDAQTLKAFAHYFAKFVQAYGKEGITIEAIHPQNEPSYATGLPVVLLDAARSTRRSSDVPGAGVHAAGTSPPRSCSARCPTATAGMDSTIVSTVMADATREATSRASACSGA